MNSNRHPADALQDIRESLKALEAKEAELRQYLLDHPEDRLGDEYAATVGLWPQSRLDISALERELGAATLTRFRVTTEARTVRLRRLPGGS